MFKGLILGIAIGYYFSDVIDDVLDRVGSASDSGEPEEQKTEYTRSVLSDERLEELEAATVEEPATVTVEEARALARHKNISLHAILSSGRWLISELEA